MANETPGDILDSMFRANPEYEVMLFERMSGTERDALAALRDDPDCAGILRPVRDSGLRIKAVCQDTVLLLHAVKDGGPLPAAVRDRLGRDGPQALVELLLDDIIQISRNGRFESGPLVQDLLGSSSVASVERGYIAGLSMEAVKHGQRLAIDDPFRLAAQMYFFNRLPVTPQWCRRLGTPDLFARFLRLDHDGYCGQVLRDAARKLPVTPQSSGWSMWALRNVEPDQKTKFDFKIYVSPSIHALPDVLPVVLDVFLQQRVLLFKIGADLPGLARPDKIVAYFHTFDQLEHVGAQLAERLSGVPVHGVPFTAELFGGGLISWGMDPHEARMFDWQERASWRVWVAHHLARSILDSRRSSSPGVVPWQFALERLRLDGVDPETWTPTHVYQDRIQR